LERGFREALPARRNGVHEAAARAAVGAEHARFQLAAQSDAGRDADGLGRAAVLDDGERAALRHAAQFVGELGRLAVVVDVVAEPDDAGALGAGERIL
jgi:hypothetical protein